MRVVLTHLVLQATAPLPQHCDSVAVSLKSAAQEVRALATEHRNMAKEVGH